METVITKVRGEDLKTNNCKFCKETENLKIFGIITNKTFDGYLIKSFGICTEHLEKLNALLSGEYDIDNIFLEKHYKPISTVVKLR